MMSAADEEPQLASLLLPNSNSNGNIKLASLNPLSNTSALISDSFNLGKPLSTLALVPPPAALPTSATSGSKSSSASPSPSILPPVNHFQPIHNRAPSTDTSNLFSPPNMFNMAPATGASAASFFDKPSSAIQPPPVLSATNNSKSPSPASILAPPSALPSLVPPPKPASEQTTATIPPATNLSGISTLPPPSMVQPPMSLPPPPPSAAASAGGSSNPYSARGALNKKVYDSSVMPIANNPVTPSAMAFMNTSAPANTVSPPSNLFVPPPVAAGPALTPEPLQAPPVFNQSFAAPLPPPPVSQAAFNTPIPASNSYNALNQQMASMTTSDSFQMSSQSYPDPGYSQNAGYSQNPGYSQNSVDPNNKTMWNWLTQNKLVNTFVEKAKHGVESIVTTVDPQMRDYIHPANKPINMVAASSNMKLLHKIREQFNDAGFTKLSLSYYDANTSTQFAPQIVGHACAIQACKEKLDNTFIYLQQTQQQVDSAVISFQDFLAELSTDCWYELAVVMFKDKANNIDLTLYTEAFPVSNEDIAQLQMYTTQDYPLKWSGFSCRLPEKNFNFNSSNQSTVLNYDTPDTVLSLGRVSHVVKSLAGLYKNKLLSLSAPK